MKIWTISSDTEGEGAKVAVFVTALAAHDQFARMVEASWRSRFGDAPMPSHAVGTYEALCQEVGFLDFITAYEHDLEGVVALDKAEAATIMAALSLWLDFNMDDPCARREHLHDLATGFDRVISLDAQACMDLRQRLETAFDLSPPPAEPSRNEDLALIWSALESVRDDRLSQSDADGSEWRSICAAMERLTEGLAA